MLVADGIAASCNNWSTDPKCRTPIALAEFYERLLGWSIARREGPRPAQPSTDGWALLRSPAGDMKIEVQWDPHSRPPVWPSVAGARRQHRVIIDESDVDTIVATLRDAIVDVPVRLDSH